MKKVKEKEKKSEVIKSKVQIPFTFAVLVIFIFVSFFWLDKIKIPRSSTLDSLLAPFFGAYSYISLAFLIFLAGVFFNRIYKSNLKKEASALIIAILLGFLLKAIVGRARPTEGFYLSSSFPSNHTIAIFSLLTFFQGLALIVWLLLSLLVAFSRVYWGYHYFSDIAFGAFIGYLVGFLINKILKKY